MVGAQELAVSALRSCGRTGTERIVQDMDTHSWNVWLDRVILASGRQRCVALLCEFCSGRFSCFKLNHSIRSCLLA